MQMSTNKADEKKKLCISLSSALLLFYDFEAHQHGVVFLDGAEAVE